MNDLFLTLAVLFSVGMIILMIKYAKFIHNQPKIRDEFLQNSDKEQNSPPGENS